MTIPNYDHLCELIASAMDVPEIWQDINKDVLEKYIRRETLVITPKKAKEILEKNTKNRRVRKAHVSRLSDMMIRGQWRDDIMPPIILGKGGVLIDGQHRLLAVVKSGRTVVAEVRSVMDETAMGVPIDANIIREPEDILLTDNRVASVINAIAAFAKGHHARDREHLVKWAGIVGTEAVALTRKTKTTRAGVSTASVRAGFVIKMKESPGDTDKILSDYSSIVSGDPGDIESKSLRSLLMQLLGGDRRGGSRAVAERLCRTIRALDRPDSKVRVSDMDAEIARTRARVRALAGEEA
jgi:hypothetical protein